MTPDSILVSGYVVAFVVLVILQFIRAISLRRLIRMILRWDDGSPVSAAIRDQVRLFRNGLPSVVHEQLPAAQQEQARYRRLTVACLLLLGVVLGFPFLAFRLL